MKEQEQNILKEDVLKKTFGYLTEKGLGDSSLRSMCKHTGVQMGSVYYWFGNKDALYTRATFYGISKVIDDISAFFTNEVISGCVHLGALLSKIDAFGAELRYFLQAVVSPEYGALIREEMKKAASGFCRCVEALAEKTGTCDDTASRILWLITGTLEDYVIWQNRGKAERQLHSIIDGFFGKKLLVTDD